VDIQTVGTILMVIGAIGFAIGLWMLLSARRGMPPPP
jgi:preprotein translocase subunit Sss1